MKAGCSRRLSFILIFGLLLIQSFSYSANQPTADRLLAELNKETSPLKKIRLYCQLSEKSLLTDYKKAIEYAETAVRLSDSLKLNLEKAIALNLCGIAWKNQGDNLKSAELLSLALDIYEQKGTKLDCAEVLKNIGETYRASGDANKSVDYLNQALKIYSDANDTIGMAKTYNRLAATSYELYYNCQAYQKLKSKNSNSTVQFKAELTNNEILKVKLDSLLSFVNLSLEYSEKLKLTDVLISSKILLAAIHTANYNLEKALQIYTDVLEAIEKTNSTNELPLALYNIAVTYNRSGDWDKSLEYAFKSYDIAKQKEINIYILLGAHLIGENYLAKYDYQKAFEYSKIYHDLWYYFYKNDLSLKLNSILYDHQIAEKELQISNKKTQALFLILSFASILLVVFLFMRILLTKNKQQRLLNEDLKRKNEIISEQNKELVKINSEKDKFFSIIAHDLRSPFNSFLGLTEIMEEELRNMPLKEIQKNMTILKKSARNLFELLSNLLEWSKIQRGMIVFSPQSINFLEISSSCILLLNENAKKKDIRIKQEIPTDLQVYADKNMLETVIRNLTSNALKFTFPGGSITIQAKQMNNNTTEISVKDTGIGMTDKIMHNLFKLSRKTSREGTDGEPSTGLGLLLCKEFVEKHGGRIWVESEVGKGSTFYFTLSLNPND